MQDKNSLGFLETASLRADMHQAGGLYSPIMVVLRDAVDWMMSLGPASVLSVLLPTS
jgi:hypothetical protein